MATYAMRLTLSSKDNAKCVKISESSRTVGIVASERIYLKPCVPWMKRKTLRAR